MRAVNARERDICQSLLGGRISDCELVEKNIVYCKTSAKGRARERGDLTGPGWFYVDIRKKTVSRGKPGDKAPEQLAERVKWIKTANIDALQQVIDDERKTVQNAIAARMKELDTIEQRAREAAERKARALARLEAKSGLVKLDTTAKTTAKPVAHGVGELVGKGNLLPQGQG